ncbi:hypothetical protein BDZ85DRAFT_249233 [Elsinoe ampelina]|uniref:Uncharacterized protein n=1 Tax=Elsinoe ampelina TaxID=302913 RepID=A0A6A6GFV3_9PEZI|nr:hypothetical protein BDZ85DRAFT_249233 [Elsinoe ampelina]
MASSPGMCWKGLSCRLLAGFAENFDEVTTGSRTGVNAREKSSPLPPRHLHHLSSLFLHIICIISSPPSVIHARHNGTTSVAINFAINSHEGLPDHTMSPPLPSSSSTNDSRMVPVKMAHEFGRKEHLYNVLASEMDSSSDILNLSLCSKDIHKIVFPWLYRRIVIRTPRKLERVTKLMYDRPDLAKQVRCLKVVIRCHAFSPEEGFPACSTMAPHVADFPLTDGGTAERARFKNFLARVRAGNMDPTRHWLSTSVERTSDVYCAILLATLPELVAIDITFPFETSFLPRRSRDASTLDGDDSEYHQWSIKESCTMDILKALANGALAPDQGAASYPKIVDLALRGEHTCGAFGSDSLGTFSGIQLCNILSSLAGMRQLQHLTLSNFELSISNGHSTLFSNLTHLELDAPRVTGVSRRGAWTSLSMLNPLESLVIKLGHPLNTASRFRRRNDEPVDGQALNTALRSHHQSLLYLKIIHFGCVTDAEYRPVHPRMIWTEFQTLRRLEIPVNFLMGSDQRLFGVQLGKSANSEIAELLPSNLNELRVSRLGRDTGLREAVNEVLPNCRVVSL